MQALGLRLEVFQHAAVFNDVVGGRQAHAARRLGGHDAPHFVGGEAASAGDPLDLGFLGAPGCGLRASTDVTNAWFVSGSTHAYSILLPANPALLNFNLYTTSAVFQAPAVNALGAVTGNGIRATIGNL